MIVPAFLARAENVTVLEYPQSSIQRPTITVFYKNNPIADASLCLYRFKMSAFKEPLENLHIKLVADAQGQIILPPLPWDIYLQHCQDLSRDVPPHMSTRAGMRLLLLTQRTRMLLIGRS